MTGKEKTRKETKRKEPKREEQKERNEKKKWLPGPTQASLCPMPTITGFLINFWIRFSTNKLKGSSKRKMRKREQEKKKKTKIPKKETPGRKRKSERKTEEGNRNKRKRKNTLKIAAGVSWPPKPEQKTVRKSIRFRFKPAFTVSLPTSKTIGHGASYSYISNQDN